MALLSPSGPIIKKIGEVVVTLDTTSLTSLEGNLWATAGLWVNSTPGEGGLIEDPLFL